MDPRVANRWQSERGSLPLCRAQDSRSAGGFVRLDGVAAGAEVLRLATRVFELGARVGIDQLAGLDPLEAVTL